MRLFILTIVTMTAFAANSVINRMALAGDMIDPAGFAIIRLAAGALTLTLLVGTRKIRWKIFTASRPISALALVAYMIGFSFAYVSLDAGIGALILFGGVQVTMFVGALFSRETYSFQQWCGAITAFAGLAYLLWPEGDYVVDEHGATLMLVAAIGWGIYSLIGRVGQDALGSTAANFALATPLAVAALFVSELSISPTGAGLAILSGVVTSGFGYALWYAILPDLKVSTAAVAQLSVPILAAYGGVMFLAESLTIRFIIAALLVIGGIAFAIASKPAAANDT